MSGFQSHRGLDPWGWLGMPMAACFIGVLVVGIPLRLFGLALPEPVFGLVPAFAWAVIRPSIMPPVLLMILGLFTDLFWGGAFGLWAVSLLVAYGFILITRSTMTGQSPAMMWAWFAVACLLAEGTAYLLTMLDALNTPNPLASIFQLLVTVLLYPFAHRLITRFEDADVRFR